MAKRERIQFSLRHIFAWVFFSGALGMLLLAWMQGQWLRNAAREAQYDTLSQVVAVAAREALDLASEDMKEVAHGITDDRALRAVLRAVVQGRREAEALRPFLDDQFHQGLVSSGQVALVQIRIYDRDYRYLAASGEGLSTLGQDLPPTLRRRAQNRDRVERLKPLSELWTDASGAPRHSLLVSVGGLRPLGYVELVVDPTHCLRDVQRIAGLPVRLQDRRGRTLYLSEGWREPSGDDVIPVPYTLRDADGEPVVQVALLSDVSAMNQAMDRAVYGVLAAIALVMILASWGVYVLLQRIVVRPVDRMVMHMERVAEGDLTACDEDKGASYTVHEMERLARSMQRAVASLASRLALIRTTGGQLSESATTLSRHAQRAVDLIRRQSEAVEVNQAATGRLKAVAEAMVRDGEETLALSREVAAQAEDGRAVVEETIDDMSGLAREVHAAAGSVKELSREVDGVSAILESIHEITEQTNLLALNAAIEAARAGEAGRGFAVVADEVRSLARRTQQSTEEIGQVLERLKRSAHKVSEVMAQGERSATIGMERATRAGEALEAIMTAVERIRRRNETFADTVRDQTVVADEIHHSLSEIGQLAAQVSEAALVFTSSGGDLAQMAVQLEHLVSVFQVQDGDPETAPPTPPAPSGPPQGDAGEVELF